MDVATRLPHHPSSIARARRTVDELAAALDERSVATVRLLVSELVTNSVRHGGTGGASSHIELVLSVRGEITRVEVADTGPGFVPRARRQEQDEGSGWGLHLLEILSHRWGTERAHDSRVWFELVG